jgi:hypothetical protein
MNLDRGQGADLASVRFLLLEPGSCTFARTRSPLDHLARQSQGLADGQHHRGGVEGCCRLFAGLAIGGGPKMCPGWLQRSGDGDP